MANDSILARHPPTATQGGGPYFSSLFNAIFIFYDRLRNPIGTRSVKIDKTYKQFSKNTLNHGGLSDLSNQVLYRFYLVDAFKESPGDTIGKRHAIACTDNRRELIFALSELL
nr:hypothetical protein [uncultured Desulfobacter sp.]